MNRRDLEDKSTVAVEDLKVSDRMVTHYDFSAWDSFHQSLSASSIESVRQLSSSLLLDQSSDSEPLRVVNEDEIDDLLELEEEEDPAASSGCANSEPDRPAPSRKAKSEPTVKQRIMRSISQRDVAFSAMDLTDEERYDNAVWRLRLLDGSMFQANYEPQEWERKEMDAIAQHLALKNQMDIPFAQTQMANKACAQAINGIFFPGSRPVETSTRRSVLLKRGPAEPGPSEANVRHSVLLKRGPVLLNGEERELMIFTDGFLFSHVELESLASMLLGGYDIRDLTCEQLEERFQDIDEDQSGSIDRNDVIGYFQSVGRLIDEKHLDQLMKKFGSDSEGTISWNDFRMTMTQLKREANPKEQKLGWQRLSLNLRKSVSRRVTRKLDVAFLRADVEKIENLGMDAGSKTRIFADSEWAHLTLAVHVKGESSDPMLVTCAKPGHVEAWMEAFQTFVACKKLPRKHSPQGVIWGKREIPDQEKYQNSLVDWMESPVDWG